MKSTRTLPLLLLTFAFAATGCSQFMGGLRRDLSDEDPYAAGGPTIGGSWSEKGFLGDDVSDGGPYADKMGAVGHSERGPASADSVDPQQGSWISPDRAAANRRDSYRGIELSDDGEQVTSFSNTPNLDPPTQRKYKNGDRATRDDFVDDTKSEGSLWGSDGQTNYYFTRNKVRAVGDIVSVKVEAGLLKDIGNETRRTLSPYERQREIDMANLRLHMGAAASDSVASSAAAPNRAPAGASGEIPTDTTAPAAPSVRDATNADVDTLKSMDVKEGDLMMAEITERYPNGNYKIRASKKIPYKNGPSRLVTLMGIARGSDIGDDDTIASGKLYEYRLESLH